MYIGYTAGGVCIQVRGVGAMEERPAGDAVPSPGDRDDVTAGRDGIVVTLKQAFSFRTDRHRLLQTL